MYKGSKIIRINQFFIVLLHLKMKRLLTLLLVVQAINLSIQNYDTNCFDQNFPSINTSIKNTTKPSGEASISVRIVHTREWSGSTGSIHDTIKDEVHTIEANVKTRLSYYYTPHYSNSDFNPRYLTLLFDGDSLKAAIGVLSEEAGPSVLTHSATWAGCAADTLSETHSSTTLRFEENEMRYYSGEFGSGFESLHLEI